MGKVNDAMIDYLKDKERFADLFNVNLFEGLEVVSAGQLQDSSETYSEEYKSVAATEKNAENEVTVKIKDSSTTRYRDIKMRLQSGGILKSDRLTPTYTLCLYHGKEIWDGPRSLKDMMDFGEDKEIWEDS